MITTLIKQLICAFKKVLAVYPPFSVYFHMDNLYNYTLKHIAERYSQDEDFLEGVMDRIAWHESRGIVSCKQIGGGPGRGLFQFELGYQQGGETAMNRLLRWFNKHEITAPSWANVGPNGVDASSLVKEAQCMMFLANVRYHPKASFKGLTYEELPEWWADYHWAGDASHREGHIKSFNHSMEHLPA